MAREELNSHVIIINEWHHIIPIYSTVMMAMPTAAPQEILGESVKQILNAIPNKHLVEYNKRTTLNEYHHTGNCFENSVSINLAVADCRSGNGLLPR